MEKVFNKFLMTTVSQVKLNKVEVKIRFMYEKGIKLSLI